MVKLQLYSIYNSSRSHWCSLEKMHVHPVYTKTNGYRLKTCHPMQILLESVVWMEILQPQA